MSDFRTNSPFPFYCKSCGLVLANTAKKPIVCPTCASNDIHQYGSPPISVVDLMLIPYCKRSRIRPTPKGTFARRASI